MLNHPEHHCYYNPGRMQDIRDEDDEATRQRGERDLRGLHTGYGSDRELQFDVVRRHCADQHIITCAMVLVSDLFYRIKVSTNTMFSYK